MNYKEAGVDVDKGDHFVELIKPMIKKTYNDRVHKGVGGFAALYKFGIDKYLATGTDGVGTKLRLAIETGVHNTIGQDLVAMCANDILCTGATPLFFLDYMATGKLDLETHTSVVEGIADACERIGAALIGGETAEMPGMYMNDDYDLAGFIVGEVSKDQLITGDSIEKGMKLIGLASSGFHSNGFSLIRKLIEERPDLKEKCLAPTMLYQNIINDLQKVSNIAGLAHITGGGFYNIERMNPKFGYRIHQHQYLNDMPEFMKEVISLSKLSDDELYKTFNMGVGMVIATADDNVEKFLENNEIKHWLIGEVTDKYQGFHLEK